MTAIGLVNYYRLESADLEGTGTKAYFYSAAFCFAAYSIFGGLVVPRANFFPASIFNTATFLALTGIPVQVFRALVALGMAFSIWKVLSIFNREITAELFESKRLMEDVTQGITEGIMLLTKDFRIIWANKALMRQTGCRAEDIVGNYCYKVTHRRDSPCEAPNDLCPVAEAVKTDKPVTLRHTHFDKEGGRHFVDVSVYPIRDAKGEIVEYVHVSRDVTPQVLLEEKYKTTVDAAMVELSKYKFGLEKSGEIVIMTDKDGKIIYVNPSFERVYGYARDEAMGQTRELTKKTKDGRLLTIESSDNPILDEKGMTVGFLSIQRDITERKNLEGKLTDKIKELESFYNLAVGRELKMAELEKEMEGQKERLAWLDKEIARLRGDSK
jgi:PAS domain S-box-containing protein